MKIKEMWASMEETNRKSLSNIFICYFLVLFTYPLIRSATTTLYMQDYGASSMPYAWLGSIVALSISIFFSNWAQSKWGVHRLFNAISSVSMIFFAFFLALHQQGHTWCSYALFIWKEVYIVLLIHLILGYTNSLFTLPQMRALFGPIGAAGSVGGILGGYLTKFITEYSGVSSLVYFTVLLLAAPCFFFISTEKLSVKFISKTDFRKGITPLEAIKDIRPYVFLIAMIVALSQFSITLAEQQFNLSLEALTPNLKERTLYYNQVQLYINMGTLFVQLVLMPYVLTRIPLSLVHFVIPLSYLAISYLGLGLGAAGFWASSLSFAYMKGSDYSMFNAVKEILYHPLNYIQKYGAKYITDMFTYRTAKAAISVILLISQNIWFMQTLMTLSLIGWSIVLIFLFKLERKLFAEKL